MAALLLIAEAVARGIDILELVGMITREVGSLTGASQACAYKVDSLGSRELVATWPQDGATVHDPEVGRAGIPIRLVDDEIRVELVVHLPAERAVRFNIDALLHEFLELAELGIVNADARRALSASRSRVLQASDKERRLIEQALREGPRRRLRRLRAELRAVQQQLPLDSERAGALLGNGRDTLDQAMTELQVLARGIHPVLLTERGLDLALTDLVAESRARVTLRSTVGQRLDSGVELGAYYIVGGSLDPSVSRGRENKTTIDVTLDTSILSIVVSDDGVGGRVVYSDRGLLKLQDRAAALGGELNVHTSDDSATVVRARIPVGKDDEPVAIPQTAVAAEPDVRDSGFDLIAAEAGRSSVADTVSIARLEEDSIRVLGSWSRRGEPAAHIRVPIAQTPIASQALRSRRSIQQVQDGVSTVCAPVIASGRPWGFVLMTGSPRSVTTDVPCVVDLLALDLATAIERDAKRADRASGDHTAALLRVATLVAHRRGPSDVFGAIAEEVGLALGAVAAHVIRFDPDGMLTVMSGWNLPGHVRFPDGGRFPVTASLGTTMLIERQGSVGIDEVDPSLTLFPEVVARMKTRAAGYLPLFVRGRLWGEVLAIGLYPPVLRPELSGFIGKLLELVAISIDNAQTRADLSASRSRVVQASDRARRHIERDLHDGAQQRFVSLAVKLQLMQLVLERDRDQATVLLREALASLDAGLLELSQLTAGIYPSLLRDVGLAGALETLVKTSGVSATLSFTADRAPGNAIALATYYVVSEALTNVAKHARARATRVEVSGERGLLTIVVTDDGDGGASDAQGTGLAGLSDRVHALNGQLTLDSLRGRGTTITVTLPDDLPKPSDPMLIAG